MQSVFAFYFSFNFGSQSYNTVLLKTLLKASTNEFSIWLCSTDPNSSFPFSGFCSHWCTLCALKICLFYALPIVFGADLGAKWETVHTRPGRVRSESEWSWVQILPLLEFLTYKKLTDCHMTLCPCHPSSLNGSPAEQSRRSNQRVLESPLDCYVTLRKWLNLSEPQFPVLQNGGGSTSFFGVFFEEDEKSWYK